MSRRLTTPRCPPDQELEWYFSYAESALRFGRVSLLPAHETTRLVSKSDDAVRHRGLQLATTVQVTLHALGRRDAAVLRAGYTPRHWPMAVARKFDDLAAVVVRLVCAAHPWPERSGHDGLEQAAAAHLARMLAGDAARPETLRRQARGLLRRALAADVHTRGSASNAACPAPQPATP